MNTTSSLLSISSVNLYAILSINFVPSQLLNELSKKVPVAKVLKLFQFSSKPERPGLFTSIRLEVVCILWTQLTFLKLYFSFFYMVMMTIGQGCMVLIHVSSHED